MMTLNVPERLTGKINELAKMFWQTPEDYLIELIEERVEHDSSYKETAFLSESEINRRRIDKSVEDIRNGKYEAHGLIYEND